MVLGFFFETLGILAWWLLNGLIVLITPRQQTLVDLLFQTLLVHEPPQEIRFEKEPIQEMVREITPIDLHIRSNYSDDSNNDVEEIF